MDGGPVRSARMMSSCEILDLARHRGMGPRLCLSEVVFATHEITDTTHLADSVYASDIDGDGDQDVLSAAVLAPTKRTVCWSAANSVARELADHA